MHTSVGRMKERTHTLRRTGEYHVPRQAQVFDAFIVTDRIIPTHHEKHEVVYARLDQLFRRRNQRVHALQPEVVRDE